MNGIVTLKTKSIPPSLLYDLEIKINKTKFVIESFKNFFLINQNLNYVVIVAELLMN